LAEMAAWLLSASGGANSGQIYHYTAVRKVRLLLRPCDSIAIRMVVPCFR
jgi:hypothetical protein